MTPPETVADVDPPLAAPIEAGAMPVPDRLTVCGEFDALSVIVRVPVSAAAEAGVKVTEIWQVALLARLDPQVFVLEKLPLVVADVIVRGAVPEFVRVTVCAVLETPWGTSPKVRVLAEREAPGMAALTVKVCAEDVPPPGLGLVTVTWTVPAEAMSEAGTAAVSWVALA
jgi:hypothetical protein